jgi:hypothetical protein
MEGKSVIAMSQGYVILGGVYIALTSQSMYIHFVYPSMNLLRFVGLAICTAARRCSVLLVEPII